jgi:hypothetical protein
MNGRGRRAEQVGRAATAIASVTCSKRGAPRAMPVADVAKKARSRTIGLLLEVLPRFSIERGTR